MSDQSAKLKLSTKKGKVKKKEYITYLVNNIEKEMMTVKNKTMDEAISIVRAMRKRWEQQNNTSVYLGE